MVVIAGDVPTHYFGKHPHQEVNLHADASQRDLPAIRQARMARRFAGPVRGDHREGVHAGGKRPPRPGARRRADGRVLGEGGSRALRAAAPGQSAGRSPRSTSRRRRRSSSSCWQRSGPCSMPEAGSCLPMRRASCASSSTTFRFRSRTLMGKGALPDDHPLVLGMTGVLGDNHQREDAGRRLAPRARDAVLRGRLQLLGAGIHVQHPAVELIHIDIDPAEIGRNYPAAIGASPISSRRSGLRPRGPQARAERVAAHRPRQGDRRGARKIRREQPAHATSGAYPMRPERILADVRAALPRDAPDHHRRRLEQERRRSAVPDPRAGDDLPRGRLRRWASARPRRWAPRSRGRTASSSCARRRWRLRAKPGDARHGIRAGHRRRVGDHEQLRLRNDSRPRESALRRRTARYSRRTASRTRRTTRRSRRPTASTA